MSDKNKLLQALLLESNESLRSAFQIAERNGGETNWEAFRNKLAGVLERQHAVTNEIRREAEAAQSPAKPDPWACCHRPQGCGASDCKARNVTVVSVSKGAHNNTYFDVTSCPCVPLWCDLPPAPPWRTKLDVAYDAYSKRYREESMDRTTGGTEKNTIRAALIAIGVNSDELEEDR